MQTKTKKTTKKVDRLCHEPSGWERIDGLLAHARKLADAEERKRSKEQKNWTKREQHNLALTLDVTAKPYSRGHADIVADYNHIYLLDGFTAQVVQPKLPVHNWTDLFFSLIVDKFVFGEHEVALQPFLTAPMIFDLPVKIQVPTKSRLRVELHNEEIFPVTIRFTFVGEGVRDLQ